MNQSILERIVREVTPILEKAGVTKAALFGSYVRGDNTVNSDVDILVDLPRGKTLFDLVGLKHDLEETLQKKVDIVEYEGLHPLLKNSILEYQYPIL
jgi:predicted nucleotidyltransferase